MRGAQPARLAPRPIYGARRSPASRRVLRAVVRPSTATISGRRNAVSLCCQSGVSARRPAPRSRTSRARCIAAARGTPAPRAGRRLGTLRSPRAPGPARSSCPAAPTPQGPRGPSTSKTPGPQLPQSPLGPSSPKSSRVPGPLQAGQAPSTPVVRAPARRAVRPARCAWGALPLVESLLGSTLRPLVAMLSLWAPEPTVAETQ